MSSSKGAASNPAVEALLARARARRASANTNDATTSDAIEAAVPTAAPAPGDIPESS